MRPISKNQYDLYVFFTRSNLAEYFNEELEWYMNDAKTLWGVVCLDRNDQNYTVIFSARDENRQIRCIDVKVDIESIEKARTFLFERAKQLETEMICEKSKNVVGDLFSPKVKKTKLCETFCFVSESPAHSAARNVINEILPHFLDVDGNFIEQFQTTGFDARLWELYLFCYFNEEGIKINRKYSAPDFLLDDNGREVSVEAVVVANKSKDVACRCLPRIEDIEEDKVLMPAKWGSSLYSKLMHTDKAGRHYWEYEHTKGKPFVIAVEDFHNSFSMTWSQNSLITYLYGYEYTYEYNEKGELILHPIKVESHPKGEGRNSIPSGFFFQEGTENISAVLHSSCGTIAKFSRIGKQCGFDENDILMYRVGTVYNPDPNASVPKIFEYLVTEENSEPWSEGITIFHNPNAKHPLPFDYFRNAAQCYLEGEYIVTTLENAIVYSSITMHFTKESELQKYKGTLEKKVVKDAKEMEF